MKGEMGGQAFVYIIQNRTKAEILKFTIAEYNCEEGVKQIVYNCIISQ